jgi:hypothetical protein
MTRRWLAAVLLMALAGCGDAPEAATSGPAATQPSSTTATKPGRTDDAGPNAGSGDAGLDGFVDAVRERVPELAADRRDEEIEVIAQQACASLAAGRNADALVAETRSLGTEDAEATDRATARELIKLAIDTACPGQRNRVESTTGD